MSLREISKRASVSIATVSRVLNTPELVKKKTRDKVLKAVEELKYNRAGNIAKPFKKSNSIAIVAPEILNVYFARIVEGIVNEAKNLDLNCTLHLTKDNIEEEQTIINNLTESNIRGVILIRSKQKYKESLKTVQILETAKIPFILVDRDIYNGNFSGIFLSNANAVYDSVSLLIKNNYSKIAIMTGPVGNLNADERLNGYKEALKNHDINLDDSLISQCDYNVEIAYLNATKILEQNPQAVFTSSNQFTVGLLKAIREKGLKLGKDIVVFSFIKLDESNSDYQNISYIDHPIDFMGEKAVKILNNKFVGTKGLIREILSYKLVFKD